MAGEETAEAINGVGASPPPGLGENPGVRPALLLVFEEERGPQKDHCRPKGVAFKGLFGWQGAAASIGGREGPGRHEVGHPSRQNSGDHIQR